MAQVVVEMDRGCGWEVRQQGAAAVTAEALAAMLPGYAIQYPHRAILDGKIVGEALPPVGR